ncbi:MAG: tRNA 2-thiouridine(34) synthase MnmA, partial [Planctomycetota bacterium]|nr:tRNA 2-thiouridine(34) synthase MnmA [Planctomycetota bacterium]
MPRVVVAMSGGVDSSVAAYLLQRQGHEIVGVFMRHGEHSPVTPCGVASPVASPTPPVDRAFQPDIPVGQAFQPDESLTHAFPPDCTRPDVRPESLTYHPISSADRLSHKQGCCSATDAEDARRVADRLDIPFYALNLEAEFGRIMDYFVAEYTAGRTPNPCVMCNNWLKFGKLFDYADSLGAQFVATGHYARLVSPAATSTPELHCGVDLSKDQSYVLFGVARRLLSRMLLPIGDFQKPQIRELAGQLGLRVANKPDSQEICFVPAGKHDEFVRQRRGPGIDTAGDIVTTDGRLVGHHPGIERFTVGQRKGLGVALGEPYFVVRVEADTRRVVIGRKEELACRELTAGSTNWLSDPPVGEFRCLVKI